MIAYERCTGDKLLYIFSKRGIAENAMSSEQLGSAIAKVSLILIGWRISCDGVH